MNFEPVEQAWWAKALSIQIDKDYDFATLTSITSVRDQSLRSNFDADFSAADILGENRVDYDFENFTQEIRLTSDGDGDLQWMVGLFHSDEQVESFRTLKYGNDVFPFADFLIGSALAPEGTAPADITGGLAPVATILTLMGAAEQTALAGDLAGAAAIGALAAPGTDPAVIGAFLVDAGLASCTWPNGWYLVCPWHWFNSRGIRFGCSSHVDLHAARLQCF